MAAHQAVTRESYVGTSELLPPISNKEMGQKSNLGHHSAIIEEESKNASEFSIEGTIGGVQDATSAAFNPQPTSNGGSNRASFKQQRQRKQRTSLTQKLALSNQLKNMMEKNKIQGE